MLGFIKKQDCKGWFKAMGGDGFNKLSVRLRLFLSVNEREREDNKVKRVKGIVWL